jgi:uncharacterized membrane-anchored protein YhcB (DUF1043 family)
MLEMEHYAEIDLCYNTVSFCFALVSSLSFFGGVMNVWFILLIGIIVGWIIGFIIIRQNYETCSEQLAALENEFSEREEALRSATGTLDNLKYEIQQKEAELQAFARE